jgi:hypothetical protein
VLNTLAYSVMKLILDVKKFYSKGFRMKKRTTFSTLEAFEHTINLFCYLLKRTSLKLESNNVGYL